MQANRSTDTGPEVRLRSLLHRQGLRFRKHAAVRLPGGRVRVDVLFRPRRVAVFIDGCFWHGCPEHGTWPKSHAAWWRAKIERNRLRDQMVDQALGEDGWTVLRFWEHEPLDDVAATIAQAVRAIRFHS